MTEGNTYEYQVLALNGGGASAPSQRVVVVAGRANLTAFRPQQFHDPENPTNAPIYAPFAKHEVSDADEESITLGPGIRINGDDDDMSETPDRVQSGIALPLENDLIEVRVVRLPGQGDMVLETQGELTLYYSYDKLTSVPIQVGFRTQPLNFVGNMVTVFVEWSTAQHGTDFLFVRDATTLVNLDAVRFHTFHTAVVAFGGDTQVPADPVLDPKNYGVFRTAIELYNEGFDVRMYNEVDIETAFNEIANSINLQGYNDSDDPLGHDGVALFGYSQGGGAVYEVAAMLAEFANPLNGNELFSISFTSYIDAIEHGGGVAETRRPLLSEFHLNQFQSFGIAQGAPIVDPQNPDEEHDRTFPGMTHTKIDDDVTVLNLLKQRLRSKVVR